VSQLLDQSSNSIGNDVGVLLVAASTLLPDVWDDPSDLLRLLWVARLKVNRRCETEAAGDAMRNAVCCTNRMADAVAEADSAGVQEGEE